MGNFLKATFAAVGFYKVPREFDINSYVVS